MEFRDGTKRLEPGTIIQKHSEDENANFRIIGFNEQETPPTVVLQSMDRKQLIVIEVDELWGIIDVNGKLTKTWRV